MSNQFCRKVPSSIRVRWLCTSGEREATDPVVEEVWKLRRKDPLPTKDAVVVATQKTEEQFLASFAAPDNTFDRAKQRARYPSRDG